MALPKKRVEEISSEERAKVEIVRDYPDSYKRRLKRIGLYKKSLEFVKVRVVGYPMVIFELAKSLWNRIRGYYKPLSEVVREVWNRLIDGKLDSYPVMEYGDGTKVYPKKTARRIATFIVSFYYASKLGFKSKGLVMFPLLVVGLWIGNNLLESVGIAEGWELRMFLWASLAIFLGVSGVYGYFGYMKSPEFKGIRHKYYSWVAKKISTEDNEE